MIFYGKLSVEGFPFFSLPLPFEILGFILNYMKFLCHNALYAKKLL